MWPSWSCGLRPIAAQDPARSGTPQNHLLIDSKRLGVAGARGVATANRDSGVDRQIPAKSWAHPRSRWLSPKPFREQTTRAWNASVGSWSPMQASAVRPVFHPNNERLLRPTPHDWLAYIPAARWAPATPFADGSHALWRLPGPAPQASDPSESFVAAREALP